jgi:hypothetical protein
MLGIERGFTVVAKAARLQPLGLVDVAKGMFEELLGAIVGLVNHITHLLSPCRLGQLLGAAQQLGTCRLKLAHLLF